MPSYLYYQDQEDQKGAQWHSIEAKAWPQHVEKAYHVTVYVLDKPEPTDDTRYKGDLWFDIDHKPDDGETNKEAIERAIIDARRLIAYLESINANVDCMEYYASGGKGFHIKIPAAVFGARQAYHKLNVIHKMMAAQIADTAQIKGFDTSMYAGGKGHMIRVPNKKRSNGKYKVPVTALEIRKMTYEDYERVTSAPRLGDLVAPYDGSVVSELVSMFEDTHAIVKSFNSNDHVVSSEALAALDGQIPKCIHWLVHKTGVKSNDSFNLAKTTLARFLSSATLDDPETLMQAFSEHWDSDRCKSYEQKRGAIKASINSVKDQGFSCAYAKRHFNDSPCSGCPVREKSLEAFSSDSLIQVSKQGYFVEDAKGVPTMITNFTLEPVKKVIGSGECLTTYRAIFFRVHLYNEGNVTVSKDDMEITPDNWLSVRDFKKITNRYGNASYQGSDKQLQELKKLITSPKNLEDIPVIKLVNTIGIYQVPENDASTLGNFAWVQEGFSLTASGLKNHFEYRGISRETNNQSVPLSINLETVPELKDDEDFTNIFFNMLKIMDNPYVIGSIIGWVCSCWLRPHLRATATIDRHLPNLQLWGSASSGKTETALLYSLLAANNNLHDTTNVPNSTPYAIKVEATCSTTVPRIFDEMNQHKCEPRRYLAARECLKASARGGNLLEGKVATAEGRTSAEVMLDNKPATSPIIITATAENREMEVAERTISLHIDPQFRKNPVNVQAFRYTRDNAMKLLPLAKALMRKSLSITSDQAWLMLKANDHLIPELFDPRPFRNWQAVFLGLDLLSSVLVDPQKQDKIDQLKDVIAKRLKKETEESPLGKQKQEIDIILSYMADLAISEEERGLQANVHYAVRGTTLYIFGLSCFNGYLAYMKRLNRIPELQDFNQFHKLLVTQPYYIPGAVITGVKAAEYWQGLSIPELQKRGIDVSKFRVGYDNP